MSTTTEILPLTETVRPADEAAVAEALRDAYQADTPVYPIGGRTSLDYGVRPSRPGIGLSLEKLNRVIDYPADDMTITVQSGLTIAELRRSRQAAPAGPDARVVPLARAGQRRGSRAVAQPTAAVAAEPGRVAA